MKISSVVKVLGAAAAVAALTPYRVEKDEETGSTTMRALLWGAKYTPATEEAGRDVNVILGLHMPKGPGRKGNDEAELFADNEPEAAVLEAEDIEAVAEEVQEAADQVQAIAEDAQEAADDVQTVAEDVQEAADQIQDVVEDVQKTAEAAFDPEF